MLRSGERAGQPVGLAAGPNSQMASAPPLGLNLASTYLGFLAVGFVCGMAAWGIYGVWATIRTAMREEFDVDYTAPDRCGGTLFLGEAFVKFAGVTLVMGVLIAVYILYSPWARADEGWVRGLMGFWIVFPFVMSLVVLLGPSAEVNRVLREHKVGEGQALQDRLVVQRARIDDTTLGAADREALRGDYQHQTKLRAELYTMRTWPYSFGPTSATSEYSRATLGSRQFS